MNEGLRLADTRLANASPLEDRIEALIAPLLDDLGFDLVRVQLSGGKRLRLQIMIEPKAGGETRIEDCTLASRTLSAVLDVEDPIDGEYQLEVSSPGIDRPLTRLKDFQRYVGHEAKLECKLAREGRKRFQGRLAPLAGNQVVLEMEDGMQSFSLNELAKARLVLTDELIAAHQAQEREAPSGQEMKG